jgi:hypothetical protein
MRRGITSHFTLYKWHEVANSFRKIRPGWKTERLAALAIGLVSQIKRLAQRRKRRGGPPPSYLLSSL